MVNKLLIIFIILNIAKGQEYPPPTDLITIPTAGTLNRGSFAMDMRIQDEGGLILGLSAGITDRFQFGLSFGSPNLIGDDSLVWYPRPEAKLKYLILDEDMTIPGVSIGLNTQGYGNYYREDSLLCYDIKGLGLYAAASKNWRTLIGNTGLHTGINYNFLEVADGDRDPNIFFGIDFEFNPEFSILIEYNSALNENDNDITDISINNGGYLNAALRWSFVESLYIELDFNNLLLKNKDVDYFRREIKITYIEYF